jgi:hypothetical protein
VQQSGQVLTLRDGPRSTVSSLDASLAKRTKISDFFLGEAPPWSVATAFTAISAGLSGRSQIETQFGRNTCYALVKLGLITSEGVALLTVRPEFAEATVRERALATSTVNIVRSLSSSKQSGLDVGDHLSRHFRTEWSDGSKKRIGAALKQWAEWASA